MAKRKRHRVIDPARARAAAGGGGGSFYDRIAPAQTTRAACPRCGARTTLLGLDGECLRCRLERRNDAFREQASTPSQEEGSS